MAVGVGQAALLELFGLGERVVHERAVLVSLEVVPDQVGGRDGVRRFEEDRVDAVGDGQYRDTVSWFCIVKGGRALRIPVFEAVDRLDLTNMNIEVSVRGGFSKGGIPLNIDGIANVKIAGVSPVLDNALQRLLGKPRPLIMRIAKETLEGYLRGVLATLTPEDVNENGAA